MLIFCCWLLQINLLYDSECPLCLHEIKFLEKRDINGNIKFTDLAAPDYNESSPENGKIDYEAGMKVIHAVMKDGEVVQGIEVFRRVYNAIGLGWVYACTSWPVIGPVVDWLYDIWARFRLQLTGRPALAQVVKERAERLAASGVPSCNDDKACKPLR
ncbi:hypothetical protein JKP88DRAFT_204080 [Tribonema minus]|uniref:Thiol-disulfide oxidoreductase DCC n=1 Tax=Tribonema minus TaxID=303371 RepID=A0A835ZGU6_9STRA|nr:hypothetical protein JKP88DRAFT_204080 [Tribonema minus]